MKNHTEQCRAIHHDEQQRSILGMENIECRIDILCM